MSPLVYFFKDTCSYLKFVLTHMEGRERNDVLGLTDIHYEDSAEALKWHQDILDNASKRHRYSDKYRENTQGRRGKTRGTLKVRMSSGDPA